MVEVQHQIWGGGPDYLIHHSYECPCGGGTCPVSSKREVSDAQLFMLILRYGAAHTEGTDYQE
jgi:hypothetical protein